MHFDREFPYVFVPLDQFVADFFHHFTSAVVSEGVFAENLLKFAQHLRKIQKYSLLRQERVWKFRGSRGNFAEFCLRWPLPERLHK